MDGEIASRDMIDERAQLPLLALFGRYSRTQECLLSGEERKS
jgi:hypothetical protein